MQAPYDYSLGNNSAMDSFYKNYQLGAELANQEILRKEKQAELEKKEAANARNQQLAAKTEELRQRIADGTARLEDFDQLSLYADKDTAANLQKIRENKATEKDKKDVSFGSQILAILSGSEPKQAIDLLRERELAATNSGDLENANLYKRWAKEVETDPIRAQQVTAQLLTYMPGGREAVESWTKINNEKRAQELQPLTLRKTTSEAFIKEAEAKFAPEKFGAELGLTRAQIEASKAARRAADASAAKSGADALRARAEAGQISAGIIPADKRPEAEGKFRKEYSEQTKGYQEVKSAYGRVLASEDSAVGDLSLIFGYMKMLDPGSVVREGEFATAQNAAGVPERIQNIYNRVISGQRLSPSQRQSFKGQAGKLYSTAQTQESQVRQGIERIAKGYGLNTENIFYTPSEVAPTAPGSPTSATGATAANANKKQRNIVVDW